MHGGGYYRPYYSGYYRPYYYRPYYAPYYYGVYSPFYFGFSFGAYPFYASFGYPCCGAYPAYYGYGYGGPYPYAGPYPSYWYSGSWASARLEVKPRDAQVYVDGYYVGLVDEFDGVFQRLDLPTGEHEVSVYQPGFRTMVQKTLFRPGEGYHFKGALEPLPPGAPADPKPVPIPRQNQGGDQYAPEMSPNDPYRPPPPPERGRTQPMQRPDERRPGEFRVEPGGGFGTLNIRVQPGDAVVQIDGEKWDSPEGGSRLSLQLAGGQHRIEVRKPGYRTYTSTITIRPGETQALNISLPPEGGIATMLQ